MTETVAGNGQRAFLDELREAAESQGLDTPGTIRAGEERSRPEVGPTALPGGVIPPPPPPPTAVDGTRLAGMATVATALPVNSPSLPPNRPPTQADLDVRGEVMAALREAGILGKPPKAPKPPRDPNAPSRFSRVPVRLKILGAVVTTTLGCGALFLAIAPDQADPVAITNAATEGATIGAVGATRAELEAQRERVTQVYRPEPFSNLCVCELNEAAKQLITYADGSNYTSLNPERALIVADQVKAYQGTGLYTITDYWLDTSSVEELRVIIGPKPGAVQLFKLPPATTPTVKAGS